MNRHYCEWCFSYSPDDARGNCSACGGWRTAPAEKPAKRNWSNSGSSWSTWETSGSAAVMTPVSFALATINLARYYAPELIDNGLMEKVSKEMGRRMAEDQERLMAGSLFGGV